MILQNILHSTEEICRDEAMFCHRMQGIFSYDAYFNAFSLGKWRTYTTVQHIKLHLSCEAAVELTVYDETQPLCSRAYTKEEANCIDLALPYREESRFLFFTLKRREDSAATAEKNVEMEAPAGSPLRAGYYYTEDLPTQDVRLALDICTYKREPFVYRNMQLLQETILQNPASPLYGRLQIFISDNGQSLDAARLADPHIHVFPNLNAGGTGGFTRGLLEIRKVQAQLGLTHMIFMDDDIVLPPDALVRTQGLLSYVREEYRRSSIAGAMLRLDRRYIQHELAANWQGGDPVVTNQGLDLRDFAAVQQNEALRQGDYAAWWYACYPLSIMREDNMPIPFFLHMDDVEFGLRNKNGIMTLNGINVWHSVFEDKRASTLSYYDIRNIMLTNALYHADGNLRFMKKYIFKRFMANTLRYRYKDIRMTYLAVRDFCRGPQYLMRLDPQEKNRRLMSLGYQMQPVTALTQDPAVQKEIAAYRKPEDITEVYKGYVVQGKWKYVITMNGWLLPARRDRVYAYPMGIHPYALFRKKELILFDPDSGTGIHVQKSWRELFFGAMLMLRTYGLLALRYKKAQKEYREGIGTLRSADFWRSYLKLEDK